MKTTLPNVVDDDSLSAMADGELHGEAFAQTLAACEHDPALLANWHDYHLIGDVLRSADLAVIQGSSRFLTRLQSRLAHEALQPNVPSAVEISAESERPTVMSPSLTNQAAANDPAFRWKIVAGFASMAAVAMMLWTQIATTGSTGSQLAQSSSSSPNHQVSEPVLVASPQGAMLRDARLEDLLAAHKQVAGNSALQMPSGFLRNATFEASPNAFHAHR
jgi:sigma-E factor negative regulatory protein RseA